MQYWVKSQFQLPMSLLLLREYRSYQNTFYALQNIYIKLYNTVKPLFTKILIFGLIYDLDNPLNVCLELFSPTKHPAKYLIRKLT